jgi:cell division protein FtsN
MLRTSKRKKARRGNSGGTLLGIMVGLVIGLAIAVAAALYMTQSSVPFVDRVKRSPERIAEPGKDGEVPDPNRSLQRNRPAAGEPAVVPSEAGLPVPPSVVPAAPGGPAPSAAPPVAVVPPSAAPASGSAPTPDPATDKPSYLLQAGAFKGQEDADSMKVKLALIGFEARIVTAEVNGVTFYRVRVGPYGKLEDMNKARTRLAENGVEASVVRQR